MISHSKTKKHKHRSIINKVRTKFLPAIPLIVVLFLILGLFPSISPPFVARGLELSPAQAGLNNGLLFLQPDASGHFKVMHKSQPADTQSSTLAETLIPDGCRPLGMYAAPHGPWLAINVTCEAGGFVQVINTASGQLAALDETLTEGSSFLNWAPTGNELILRAHGSSNGGIYLVQIANGKSELLPVPANTYDIALSTNKKRMIYSLTQGLGYGSETWIANIDGTNAQRVLSEPHHIIAFANWSPSGKEIAYIRMPDSNIPFTIGELWLMGGDGQNPVLLGNADAGHGYRPSWSPDGQQIAFVGRELPGNVTDADSDPASYEADKLVSNIYLADVRTRHVSSLTQFDSALTENPVWSPDGNYIAFSSTAGNGADIWVFEPRSGNLNQVTHGAAARQPAWLTGP